MRAYLCYLFCLRSRRHQPTLTSKVIGKLAKVSQICDDCALEPYSADKGAETAFMDNRETMHILSTARCVKTAPDHYVQIDSMGLQQLEHLEKELEQAKQKILVLRAQDHRETSSPESKVSESRYWTNEERQRFKKALKTFGTDFAAIAKFVGTRSSTQVRTHAQKYYAKLIRDYKRSGKSAAAAAKVREEKGSVTTRLTAM